MNVGFSATIIVLGLFVWIFRDSFFKGKASIQCHIRATYYILGIKNYLLPLILTLTFTFFFVSTIATSFKRPLYNTMAIASLGFLLGCFIYSYKEVKRLKGGYYKNLQEKMSQYQ